MAEGPRPGREHPDRRGGVDPRFPRVRLRRVELLPPRVLAAAGSPGRPFPLGLRRQPVGVAGMAGQPRHIGVRILRRDAAHRVVGPVPRVGAEVPGGRAPRVAGHPQERQVLQVGDRVAAEPEILQAQLPDRCLLLDPGPLHPGVPPSRGHLAHSAGRQPDPRLTTRNVPDGGHRRRPWVAADRQHRGRAEADRQRCLLFLRQARQAGRIPEAKRWPRRQRLAEPGQLGLLAEVHAGLGGHAVPFLAAPGPWATPFRWCRAIVAFALR